MSEKEEKRAEIPHINQLNGRDNKIKKRRVKVVMNLGH